MTLWAIVAIFAVFYTYLKYFHKPYMHPYPEAEKVEIVRSCMREGSSLDFCVCGLNTIRTKYTYETLRYQTRNQSEELMGVLDGIKNTCRAAN